MAKRLDSVTRHLYKALLRRASTIDSHPACKALILQPPADTQSPGFVELVSTFLAGRYFYLPQPRSRSVVDLVQRAFRFPHEGVNEDTAFEGLRYANRILRVAKEAKVVDSLTDGSTSFLSRSRGTASADSGHGKAPGAFLGEAPGRGLVLVAHPMQSGFFARTVVLLLRHDDRGSSGVCLNAPLNVKLWSLRQVGSPFASHLDRCDEEGGSASQGDASGRQSGAQAGASSKAPSTSQAPGDPTEETAGRKTKSKGVSEIVNHFRDNWVSLGGPVPGPDHSMAVLHSLESLGGDRIVSGDSATTKPCTDELHAGGVWKARDPKACLLKAVKENVSGRQIRFFAGTCEWGPGQLADEISRGVWVLSRASLDTLDVMEHRHADEAAKERHGMRWCVDQRHGAWSRVMAELGGEHFAFAQMSRDIDALWEKGQ